MIKKVVFAFKCSNSQQVCMQECVIVWPDYSACSHCDMFVTTQGANNPANEITVLLDIVSQRDYLFQVRLRYA